MTSWAVCHCRHSDIRIYSRLSFDVLPQFSGNATCSSHLRRGQWSRRRFEFRGSWSIQAHRRRPPCTKVLASCEVIRRSERQSKTSEGVVTWTLIHIRYAAQRDQAKRAWTISLSPDTAKINRCENRPWAGQDTQAPIITHAPMQDLLVERRLGRAVANILVGFPLDLFSRYLQIYMWHVYILHLCRQKNIRYQ